MKHSCTVKAVENGHSQKDQKLVLKFQDQLLLNAGQRYYRMGAFCNTFDLH